MKHIFGELDRVLRGDATRFSDLRSGRVDIPIGGLATVTILLATLYGVCVGVYALTMRSLEVAIWQLIASAVKIPVLFILTLVVTLPSLYVYNALVGSRLTFDSVLRLLIASISVIVAVAASQGPIVVFFAVSTTSYPFMILLNVTSLGVAGILGLTFLGRTLNRIVYVQEGLDRVPEGPEPSDSNADDEKTPPEELAAALKGALDLGDMVTERTARIVFRTWLVVFALVGAQMSWVLRPFIGHPDLEFQWFRERESNFFEAVVVAIGKLFQ